MDPGTLAILAGVGQGVGNAISGNQQGKINREQLAEQKRQFDKQHQMQRMGAGFGYQRILDQAPLRDRLMYNLTQKAGLPARSFKPRDMFNPGQEQTQYGGVDQDQLAGKLNQYTPGAGGVNTDILKRMLGELGYSPGSQTPPRPKPFNIDNDMDPAFARDIAAKMRLQGFEGDIIYKGQPL